MIINFPSLVERHTTKVVRRFGCCPISFARWWTKLKRCTSLTDDTQMASLYIILYYIILYFIVLYLYKTNILINHFTVTPYYFFLKMGCNVVQNS